MNPECDIKKPFQPEPLDPRPVPMDLEQLRSLAESKTIEYEVPAKRASCPVNIDLRPVPFDLKHAISVSLPEPKDLICEIAVARTQARIR